MRRLTIEAAAAALLACVAVQQAHGGPFSDAWKRGRGDDVPRYLLAQVSEKQPASVNPNSDSGIALQDEVAALRRELAEAQASNQTLASARSRTVQQCGVGGRCGPSGNQGGGCNSGGGCGRGRRGR